MVTSDVIFETVTAHIYNIYRGLKFTKLLHNIVQFQIPVTHVHLEKNINFSSYVVPCSNVCVHVKKVHDASLK